MKAPPSPREQLERLHVLVRRAGKFWKRGLAVFFLSVLLAVPFVLTRPRSYRSDTLILYQENIQASDLGGGDSAYEGARRVGVRLRELLFSRASLGPIIHDLNLYPKLIVHGEDIEAVEALRKDIVFKAQPDGDTYEISYTGSSPGEAQAVTQRLADCIIQEAAKRREDKAKTLEEFLSAESLRNEPDLRQKEAALTRFVVLHPEYATRLQGLPAPATTSTGAAATGDPLLASLEARAAAIERRLNAKTTPGPAPRPIATFQPPPDGADLVAARKALADKLAMFTDKHPDVAAARTRLKEAEAAQATINADALAAWRAEHSDPGPPASATEEAALRRELATTRAQIVARRSAAINAIGTASDAGALTEAPAPALELEFRRLQGEVGDARDRQQQLQSRLFRASVTASSIMDDRNIQVSVLDPAYLPVRPTSKPRSLILEGLIALSFVLGVATAFSSALLDNRIYDRHDVERLEIVPVIAIIPKPRAHPIQRLPRGADSLEGP